jgi:hypothetical protein
MWSGFCVLSKSTLGAHGSESDPGPTGPSPPTSQTMKVFKRFRGTEPEDDPEVVEATNEWKKARKQYAALAAALAHANRPLMESAERWQAVGNNLDSMQMGQAANVVSLIQSVSETEKRSAQSLFRYASLLESKLVAPILHAFDESKASFEVEKSAYKQAKKDLKSKVDKGAEEEEIHLMEQTVSDCAKKLTRAIRESLRSASKVLMQSLYTSFRACRMYHQLALEAHEQELSFVLRLPSFFSSFGIKRISAELTCQPCCF